MKRILQIASILLVMVGLAVSCKNPAGGSENISEGFVKIDGGTFEMGSTDGDSNERPVHNVTLSSYLICDHEVTQAEYETYCTYGGPYQPSETYGKGNNNPVYYVNWYDAIVYCNVRSMKEGLTPCYKLEEETDPKKFCGPSTSNDSWNGIECDFTKNGYRLPTEAEWEIAARGGLTGNVWAGTATESELDDYAWFTTNSENKTHEVKKKQPNGYGLYDMSGNVWEWCWDWYDNYETNQTDPTGPATAGSYRVYRGGSWINSATNCRASYRSYGWPYRRSHLGFRLARSVL